jgi:glycosyltransferase involved in cell wall biosynthesis
MIMKKTLAYVSSEWFADTDLTVLSNLIDDFNIYWYYTTNLRNPRYPISDIKKYANKYGIALEIDDVIYKYEDPRNFLRANLQISKIKKVNPDIIYKIGTNIFWNTIALFRIERSKIVLGVHDCITHQGRRGQFFLQLSIDYCIKSLKHFILFSKTEYDVFCKRFPQKHAVVVGMSVKDFGNTTKTPSPITNEIKLLFFGQIQKYKGLDILIKSLEELFAANQRKITLSICGKGREWEACAPLIQHADQYNLQIRFIENNEVADLFSSHHFLVLPYRNATQSGPIMIAANYGLPIICPDINSFTNVYNSESAIFYPQGKLEEALYKVNELSQADYDSYRKHAAKLKEQYSEKNISIKYKMALLEAIAK